MMKKKILASIAITCLGTIIIVAIFTNFFGLLPKLIDEDPAILALSSTDVAGYEIYESGYMSAASIARNERVSEHQLETWGYDKGYGSDFLREEQARLASFVLRFTNIDGAKSAFDEISYQHRKAEGSTEIVSSRYGDESKVFDITGDGGTQRTVIFRKANYVVDVTAIKLYGIPTDAETFAEIIADRF